jgi:hypothetical protein
MRLMLPTAKFGVTCPMPSMGPRADSLSPLKLQNCAQPSICHGEKDSTSMSDSELSGEPLLWPLAEALRVVVDVASQNGPAKEMKFLS